MDLIPDIQIPTQNKLIPDPILTPAKSGINTALIRILVVYACLKGIRIAELAVAMTRQFCHINFACNSVFYFFLASECRVELKKTCCC